MTKSYSSLIFDEIDEPVILGGFELIKGLKDNYLMVMSRSRLSEAFNLGLLTIVRGSLIPIDSPSPSLYVPLLSALIALVFLKSPEPPPYLLISKSLLDYPYIPMR